MTALEEIKKALAAAEQFIVNGVELGYIRLPDPQTPDSAHDTLTMIRKAQTAIENLRLENEELIAKANEAATAANSLRILTDAAESKVERLLGKLEPFSRFSGVLFERNFNRTDSVAEMTDVDGIPHVIFAGSFFDARTALASTGGEHNAE